MNYLFINYIGAEEGRGGDAKKFDKLFSGLSENRGALMTLHELVSRIMDCPNYV